MHGAAMETPRPFLLRTGTPVPGLLQVACVVPCRFQLTGNNQHAGCVEAGPPHCRYLTAYQALPAVR